MAWFRDFKNSNYDQRTLSLALNQSIDLHKHNLTRPQQHHTTTTTTTPPSFKPHYSTHPQLLHIHLLPSTTLRTHLRWFATATCHIHLHNTTHSQHSPPSIQSSSYPAYNLPQMSTSFGNNHPQAQDRGNASSMPTSTLPSICNINTTNCYIGCNITNNYFHHGSDLNPSQQATTNSTAKSGTWQGK